jgi:hypothetical protein
VLGGVPTRIEAKVQGCRRAVRGNGSA